MHIELLLFSLYVIFKDANYSRLFCLRSLKLDICLPFFSLLFLIFILDLFFDIPGYYFHLDLLYHWVTDSLEVSYIYSILIDMCLHLPFRGMSLCLLTPLRISKFPTFQSGLSSTWFLFLALMLYRYHRNHMSLSGECRNWLSHKTYAKIVRRQNW